MHKWDVQHWGFGRFFETARTAWSSTPNKKKIKKIKIINKTSQMNQK
jgi:hypothetical protein